MTTPTKQEKVVEEQYEADVKQAMRAFLQRAEVRLSTMHRIAGVFLNGAGLLLLLPILFRDAIEQIAGFFLTNSISNSILSIFLFAFASVPFFISLVVPVYALYLLIKDLVYFYFVSSSPGFPTTFFNPRFSLAGIALSKDEVPESITKEIFRLQYTSDLRNFILPLNQNIAAYFDELARDNDDIIPRTRTMSELKKMGILDNLSDENKRDIKRFNAALGLAGFLDRTLIEEVARLEASLVRHAISLRRLVLRYIKALLALVWTTIVAFMAITTINVLAAKLVSPIIISLFLSVIYGVWSFLMPKLIRLPINWLFESNPHLKPVKDIELVKFERSVQTFCLIGTTACVLIFVATILVAANIIKI